MLWDLLVCQINHCVCCPAIFLGTLKCSFEETKNKILGVEDSLDESLLTNLMKQLPEQEIISNLKEYKKQMDELHEAEQFLCTVSAFALFLLFFNFSCICAMPLFPSNVFYCCFDLFPAERHSSSPCSSEAHHVHASVRWTGRWYKTWHCIGHCRLPGH